MVVVPMWYTTGTAHGTHGTHTARARLDHVFSHGCDAAQLASLLSYQTARVVSSNRVKY
jgi:hypothetical protein